MSNDNWNDMLNEMKKDQEEQSGGSRKYWAPPRDKEGEFPIRILPPLKALDEKKFYFPHKTHWIDGQPYECLNQTLTDKKGNLHEAENCPACSMSKKFYKLADNNRNSEEWKLAYDFSAKLRYVYRVIVRDKDDPTIPEYYETGKTIFNILAHIMTETDFGIIVDPKNGRDFNVNKKGTGRNVKYDQSLPAVNPTALFDNVEDVKKCLEHAKKMGYNTLIEFVSYDDMKKVIGNYLEADTGDDEKESVKSNKPAPVMAEAAIEAEESDDDELDDILSEFESV